MSYRHIRLSFLHHLLWNVCVKLLNNMKEQTADEKKKVWANWPETCSFYLDPLFLYSSCWTCLSGWNKLSLDKVKLKNLLMDKKRKCIFLSMTVTHSSHNYQIPYTVWKARYQSKTVQKLSAAWCHVMWHSGSGAMALACQPTSESAS